MSKELMLADVALFCRAASGEPKPTVLDEDNAASYRDPVRLDHSPEAGMDSAAQWRSFTITLTSQLRWAARRVPRHRDAESGTGCSTFLEQSWTASTTYMQNRISIR